MSIVLGLALLAMALYMATLTYVLRGYSRARLSDALPEEQQPLWFDWLDRYEEELQALTGFVRIACNLAVLIWVYAEFLPRYAGVTSVPWAAALTLGLMLIFSIGIPHALALHAAEGILSRNLWALVAMRFALWPISQALCAIEFIVRRLLGRADPSQEEETERTEQEILEAVSEGKLHGAVDEEQEEMIESVFELRETTVNAIMTPRTEIDAIKIDATAAEARDVIHHAGHSRIPVYEKTIDHIVGVLYAKDLIQLNGEKDFELRKILRPVTYVPGAKTIDALLREFRNSKVHIAIVLDEYGGTAGLVTIEDILEELVGEIDDEYDKQAAPAINRVSDDELEVDARVHVSEINDELQIALPDEGDYETIGGFVFATLGKIPVKGEEFAHDNLRFHIMDAEPRRIKRLRIHVVREPQTT